MKNLILFLFLSKTFLFSQTQFYFQDFENASNPSGIDWTFDHSAVSNNNNYWIWGTGTAGATTGSATYQGTQSMQIWRRASNAWSASYGNHANQNRTAQKTFNFSTIPTDSDIEFSFYLLSRGEILSGTYYDYFRVEVNGTIVLGPLVNINAWTLQTIDLSSYAGNSSVTVTFRWINDGSTANQPASRIDNIKIEYIEPIPLPIVLKEFYGKPHNTENIILWSTSSESNSSHFIVESSEDGLSWNNVEKVNASGYSQSLISYSIIDFNVIHTRYYRLFQYDFDGAFSIYGPIVVPRSCVKKIIVKYVNLMGQEVSSGYTGFLIEIYSDGTMKKIIR
jgi:hypothetical protein